MPNALALPPATLTVSRDGTLVLEGRSMRAPGLRPPAEVQQLMKATEQLSFFRDLRADLKADFPAVHYTMCAGMHGATFQSGEFLFRGGQSLQWPMLLLAGRATLLASATHGALDLPPELGPGQCLSFSSMTWLEPRAVAAAACCHVQLLRLPPAAYAERAKLSHLRMLSRRAAALGSLALLSGCTAPALRALAHAASAASHRQGTLLAREGAACQGLLVLLAGGAEVATELAGDRRSSAPNRVERTIAFISAPEVIGVIDLLDALLNYGQHSPAAGHWRSAGLAYAAHAPERHRPGLGAKDDLAEVESYHTVVVDARHGVTVRAASAGETLLLPTAAIVRHLGASTLATLAHTAFDRKIVRRALKEELQAQFTRQLQEEQLRAQALLVLPPEEPVLLGNRANAIARASIPRPPSRPQTAVPRKGPRLVVSMSSPRLSGAAIEMLTAPTTLRASMGSRRPSSSCMRPSSSSPYLPPPLRSPGRAVQQTAPPRGHAVGHVPQPLRLSHSLSGFALRHLESPGARRVQSSSVGSDSPGSTRHSTGRALPPTSGRKPRFALPFEQAEDFSGAAEAGYGRTPTAVRPPTTQKAWRHRTEGEQGLYEDLSASLSAIESDLNSGLRPPLTPQFLSMR